MGNFFQIFFTSRISEVLIELNFWLGMRVPYYLKEAYPPENRFFFLHFPKEKLYKSMSLKSYQEIPKIDWDIANLVAKIPPKKNKNKHQVKIGSKL